MYGNPINDKGQIIPEADVSISEPKGANTVAGLEPGEVYELSFKHLPSK